MSDMVMPDGRVFKLIGSEPYTTKYPPHKRVTLLIWEGACTTCGAPFTVRTPERFDPARTNSFMRKRCDAHKLTRSQLWAAILKGRKRAR